MITTDILSAWEHYCQEAERYPLLTRQEECELACRYQAGDEQAGHWLICCNLRLGISMIKKYSTNARVDKMDLVQQANLGLIRAAKKFDAESGYRFSTYAVPSILASVSRYRDEQCRAVHIPQRLAVAHRKQLQGQPSAESIRTLDAAGSWLINECYSLDAAIPGDDSDVGTHGDILEDPHAEAAFDQALTRIEVEPLLAKLPTNWRVVIEQLYGLTEDEKEYTYTALATRFGRSKTRIQQIEKQALELLRQALGVEAQEADQLWVSQDDPNYVSVTEAAQLADCSLPTCMQIIRSLGLTLYRVEKHSRRALARTDVARVRAAVCRDAQQARRRRTAS